MGELLERGEEDAQLGDGALPWRGRGCVDCLGESESTGWRDADFAPLGRVVGVARQ